MKTGASIFFLIFLSASTHCQVLVDTLHFPLDAAGHQLQVSMEGEIFALPFDHDTLCHSTDGGTTWTIAAIPRSWQQSPPVYSLSALPHGVALLAYAEMNAARDSQWVGFHRTTDTGRTWSSDRFLAVERLPGIIRRVIPADTSTTFFDIESRWYRSDDAGASLIPVPELEGMGDLQFAGNGIGWAVNPGSRWTHIAHTKDYGQSWDLDSIAAYAVLSGVHYDGSAVLFLSGSTSRSYWLHTPTKGGRLVFPPSGGGVDEYGLSWINLVALNDGRILASALDNAERGYLFVTADEGTTWTPLHLQSAANGAWAVYRTAQLMRNWKISDNAVIVQHRAATDVFSVIRLPEPIPAALHVENYSTMHHRQVLARWTDPFMGRTASITLERSASDSNWTLVPAGVAESQMRLDSSDVTGEEIRYRVTLQSSDGVTARSYSDAITPALGAYVDLPSYIFPDEDRMLVYDVRRVVGILGRSADTVNTRRTLHFFSPIVFNSRLASHDVRVVTDTVGGGSDTAVHLMNEWLIPEHRFSDKGVYFGLDYALDFGARFLSYGPVHPGMLPSALFDGQSGLEDSVRFRTSYGVSVQQWTVDFVAKRGIGILSIHADMNGPMAAFQTIDWQLVRHVNAADQVSAPVAAYALSSYPNPLIDAATVRYDLPTTGDVTLTVHDILGRRVATLANGRRSAGTHHATFRAAGLTPGTYLLRLVADKGSITRLISLIR